jgi:hypothetical protein
VLWFTTSHRQFDSRLPRRCLLFQLFAPPRKLAFTPPMQPTFWSIVHERAVSAEYLLSGVLGVPCMAIALCKTKNVSQAWSTVMTRAMFQPASGGRSGSTSMPHRASPPVPRTLAQLGDSQCPTFCCSPKRTSVPRQVRSEKVIGPRESAHPTRRRPHKQAPLPTPLLDLFLFQRHTLRRHILHAPLHCYTRPRLRIRLRPASASASACTAHLRRTATAMMTAASSAL